MTQRKQAKPRGRQRPIGETEWVLFGTTTCGYTPALVVVEVAAQRMRGWAPEGEPFHHLLQPETDLPAGAARDPRYPREMLERDGEPPERVYRELAAYAGNRPLVSYHLEQDWEQVLQPAWRRWRISSGARRQFCAHRLTQRLLDPVPAGNCKLTTLRQYYRLPGRSPHTALDDVQTLADLFARILRPIAESRGLDTWEKLAAYAAEEWFPSRLPFGQHQGRNFREAREDAELRRWLEWLAAATNSRSAAMGRWYLAQLDNPDAADLGATIFAPTEISERALTSPTGSEWASAGLVRYVNPALEELRQLVAGARARLAELEARYTVEKSRVDATQALLFRHLREHYQTRDRLQLIVHYRQKFLESYLRGGKEEVRQAETDYGEARRQLDEEYEQTADSVARQKQLTPAEEEELSQLWRKLVKLYHPDRFAHEPAKLATYAKLTAAINQAKDNGDIGILREIAQDPHGFILRQGWTSLDFRDEVELKKLRRLYEALQLEIFGVIDRLEQLQESPDYELALRSQHAPGLLERLAEERAALIQQEIAELRAQADRLEQEITELTGEPPQSLS